jgi:hypothetical protein
MTKRIHRLLVAVAALVAVALGGAVFAQAQSSRSAAHETASLPDPDQVQSGDQTTPDTAKVTATGSGRHHSVGLTNSAGSNTAGGGSGQTGGGGADQSGDQNTADSRSAGETPGAENPETGTGSESAPTNDGPGGHADEPGKANADHQFQGNE